MIRIYISSCNLWVWSKNLFLLCCKCMSFRVKSRSKIIRKKPLNKSMMLFKNLIVSPPFFMDFINQITLWLGLTFILVKLHIVQNFIFFILIVSGQIRIFRIFFLLFFDKIIEKSLLLVFLLVFLLFFHWSNNYQNSINSLINIEISSKTFESNWI